jgi:hypothetical protein
MDGTHHSTPTLAMQRAIAENGGLASTRRYSKIDSAPWDKSG